MLQTIPGTDMEKIRNSGQCFRLDRLEEAKYGLVANGRWLEIAEKRPGEYLFSCAEEEYTSVWRPYFDADEDYSRYLSAVPESDPYLQKAVTFGGGIRILRQDPWEMLVTFIISQRKNIPAIKRSVEALSALFGTPIAGAPENTFSFPSAEALAAQSMDSLAPCSLGYRAPYVLAAARLAAGGKIDLMGLESAGDEELFSALLAVPGVGAKVASCVMLYGYHRLDAFPKDTWINRTIDCEYGGCFDEERYRGFRGVIQQYMFYYARTTKKG